uniref:Ribonuclease H-like domain-containing protein n=1 Tax=Tanacetum cinerariifolium TaxID=118510 RepID=A0A6L2MLI1_TANCI|nr:ribonuclease H-like domain-containing protein [Tanacetum cinerariifolium]
MSFGEKTSGQVEVSNRGLKRILERAVGENRPSWSDKLDDALWSFRTAYKTPIGCTPYKKVQINKLNELRDQAYENSLIYKEKTKRLHDLKIKNRVFNIGDRVLLFNSRLKIFSSKLKSRWSGPFTISQVYPYGTVELSQPDGPNFKVNGHRLKHYFREDVPKLYSRNLKTHAGFYPPVFISPASLGNHVTDTIKKGQNPSKTEQNQAQNEKRGKVKPGKVEAKETKRGAKRSISVLLQSKLGPEGAHVQDPTLYRNLAGRLQYLTFIRPDLSYAVQHICLYIHDPREPHLAALKRILRYIQGTLDLGLHLYASSTTSLVSYTDADWAVCPSTRMSTSGYCVFLGDNLLSWSAKRQHTLSRFSSKAEYWGVANVVAETSWLRNLLRELHSPLSTATLIYCDNVSDVYMSANPIQHQRTKHIEIDIHFFRDIVTTGHVRVLHMPSHF